VIDYLEWIGALSGLLGAFLLATHTNVSRYGWVAFLAANIAFIGFAIGIERYGLLLQQVGFMATSLLGLYRAGMIPAWIARYE
jgi:nicotinamide riboside transporter PnuC